MSRTLQSNIKSYAGDMSQYSFFLGGLDVKASALEQYDPLRVGYPRLFFLRMPRFMEIIMERETKNFKHLLEYGFVGVDGLQNLEMEFEQMTGGYAGRQFDVPTVAKDGTNSITVKVYEFAGSPVREYTSMWISGISDQYTGMGHYHGALDMDNTLKYSQVNHIAEAIYLQTDPTGRSNSIEYACLLTNMMPKGSKTEHFNYNAGEHPLTEVDIEFTATKYESPQINEIASALLDKYKILRDYLNFVSGYTTADVEALPDSNVKDWETA